MNKTLLVHTKVPYPSYAQINNIKYSAANPNSNNKFPWIILEGLGKLNNPCTANILVNENGKEVQAGIVKIDIDTGRLITVNNENSYKIVVNGIRKVTLQQTR